MDLDYKKILTLVGGIAAAVSTGGLTAAIVPGLGLAAALIPDADPDKQSDEQALEDWEREMILGWVSLYKRFMDIPMEANHKRYTVMGSIRSDFIMKYADIPKERWVEQIHSMLVMAVHGELAVAKS